MYQRVTLGPIVPLLAAFLTLAPAAAGAQALIDAAPSDRFSSDEVTLRLVATPPAADGSVRAALLVDLAPGWKTYWTDPGQAGVPPKVDLAGSLNLAPGRTRLPPPIRFGDDTAMSNGYSGPMAMALELRELRPGARSELRASVMIGVCEIVCIPVQAELALALTSSDAHTARLVGDAFAALPAASGPGDGITEATLSGDGKQLLVSAVTSAPEDTTPDLFVAGPKGWYFGRPKPATRTNGTLAFAVPVIERPRRQSTGPLLVDAVMTLPGKAFEARRLDVGKPLG